jgi:hypothetical protein
LNPHNTLGSGIQHENQKDADRSPPHGILAVEISESDNLMTRGGLVSECQDRVKAVAHFKLFTENDADNANGGLDRYQEKGHIETGP